MNLLRMHWSQASAVLAVLMHMNLAIRLLKPAWQNPLNLCGQAWGRVRGTYACDVSSLQADRKSQPGPCLPPASCCGAAGLYSHLKSLLFRPSM